MKQADYINKRDVARIVSKVDEKELLEQCKVWLEEKESMTKGSIQSYISYQRKLDEEIFVDWQLNNSDETDYLLRLIFLIKENKEDEAKQIIETLDAYLTELLNNAKNSGSVNGYTSKEYTNWRSGWRKFATFLFSKWEISCDVQECLGQQISATIATEYDTNRLWQETIEQTISKEHTELNAAKRLEEQSRKVIKKECYEELFNKFAHRLRTQDRPGVLPIRSIVTLFNSYKQDIICSNYINLWFTHSLEKMLVYAENEIFTFKDIQYINLIADGSVMVSIDGKGTKQMFTHTKNGNLVPMKATELSDISIEHQQPITKFIKDNADKLRILPLTEEKIEEFKNNDDNNKKVEFLLSLIFDLDFIAREIQLELMQKSENTNPGH